MRPQGDHEMNVAVAGGTGEETLRTLVFADCFPPLTGGSQIILYEIVRRFPADVAVVCTPPVPGDEEFDRQQPFPIIRSKTMRPLTVVWPEMPADVCQAMAREDFYCRWFRRARVMRWLVYLRVLVAMIRAARRERAEVIFCGHPFLGGIAARCHASMAGVPYVVYSYGEELAMLLSRPGVARALQRWALGGASRVFAISRFSRDVLLALGVQPDRVRVQFPAVSEVFFAQPGLSPPEVKRRLGLAEDAPLLLTAARLMERKGVDTVIRALPRVLEVIPATVYLVAGSGADEPRLRALAAQVGVGGKVKFLGDSSHFELLNYYHACDVFVMPNREIEATGETETFGVVFLEANACGKPVIGGRVGGVLDAVEDGITGLLVDPTDVGAVGQAILRLLTDPCYARQLGENGRRRARQEFSWDRNSAEVQKALAEAVAVAKQKERNPRLST